ncbi:hypothetical protein Bca52824_005555 [Brassica carinata]|uniref:Uncharacterized protein n=1 Tax=Brassica carinata TaxID=52824 RepID=A0A8X8BGQ6_BRACI|nr:hypothetical protein Bca52824_005555 [Brassica carinata]
MNQESLQIYQLWRLAVQERDEAREHLKHSLAELSQLRELYSAVLLSEQQQMTTYYPEAIDETTCHQNCNYRPFPGILRRGSCLFHRRISFRSNQSRVGVESTRDYETVVLEMIGGTLPEYGKFLQAVSEVGSLVESLFIAGPVPKWINPPVLLSSQRPVMSNHITVNWNNGGLEFGSLMQNRSFPV